MSQAKFGDRYSGIVTVLAILLAVEYSTGMPDVWDFATGILGLVLARQYIKDLDGEDRLLSGLTGALTGLSIIITIYALGGICLGLLPKGISKYMDYKSSVVGIQVPAKFVGVLLFSIVFYVLFQCRSKHKSTR